MSQHDANSNTALFSRGHLEKAPRGTSWWTAPKSRAQFMAEAEAKAAAARENGKRGGRPRKVTP